MYSSWHRDSSHAVRSCAVARRGQEPHSRASSSVPGYCAASSIRDFRVPLCQLEQTARTDCGRGGSGRAKIQPGRRTGYCSVLGPLTGHHRDLLATPMTVDEVFARMCYTEFFNSCMCMIERWDGIHPQRLIVATNSENVEWFKHA